MLQGEWWIELKDGTETSNLKVIYRSDSSDSSWNVLLSFSADINPGVCISNLCFRIQLRNDGEATTSLTMVSNSGFNIFIVLSWHFPFLTFPGLSRTLWLIITAKLEWFGIHEVLAWYCVRSNRFLPRAHCLFTDHQGEQIPTVHTVMNQVHKEGIAF